MKTSNKGLLIPTAVVIATAVGLTIINSSTATKTAQAATQSNLQSATPTPIKSYTKLPGTWTYDCEFPVQRPLQIMLTCADGGMIVTHITWNTWTSSIATGKGTYSQNMCDPSCADGTRVNVPVTIKLSGPFEYKGRNLLKTLEITSATGQESPNGDTSLTWDIAEFAVRMNWG